MNFLKVIVLFNILFFGNLYANEQLSEKENKEAPHTYINIDANVKDTSILLNGEEIGTTPINAYKIEANKPLKLTAIANKDYYEKDLIKTINVRTNIQKDFIFKFEKAKTKLFLVGDKAQLFINNKFIKALDQENRIVEIDAGKNIELYFEDNYKTKTLFKDLKANQFYEIPYSLLYIPKELRLLTTTIEDLMWEDTKHASGTKVDWFQAKMYCEDLKLAGVGGWKMPTLKQLQRLQEKYQDKMYHGHGKTFYWSSDTSKSKNEIWDYASVVDFKTARVTTPIKELQNGYVRCVKDIGDLTEIVVDKKVEKKVFKSQNEEIGYDPESTKNLKKLMLK